MAIIDNNSQEIKKTVALDENSTNENLEKETQQQNIDTQKNDIAEKKNSPNKIFAAKKQKKSYFATDGFEQKVVKIKRINKTTKGGRKMRFSVLLVIGDRKGNVGFGMGKSIEIPNAMQKALKNAKNNLTKVIMTKKGSIYHDIVGKACAAKILLKPAPLGTGIVAGGAIRTVIELAGYSDIYTKNLGKNTPANMIQATINGLKAQKTVEYIAKMRDKKITEL
ncbi:30S ribosomal protein S5 [bacterium]|nr:30S ribosomal protein S5 [bacterium]